MPVPHLSRKRQASPLVAVRPRPLTSNSPLFVPKELGKPLLSNTLYYSSRPTWPGPLAAPSPDANVAQRPPLNSSSSASAIITPPTSMDVVLHSPPARLDVETLPPPASPDVGHSPPPIRTDVAHNHDRLDALIVKAVASYEAADSWSEFVRSTRGRGDLHPDVGSLPHPAAHLLKRFQRSGTPAIMKTSNWSTERIQAAIKRGAHTSAKAGVTFLRNEFADMMEKQQWTVLPASMLVGRFPELRVSPLGLVAQAARRDRMIADYSYFRVNADTAQLAFKEAMQFGKTLKRLLRRIHRANPRFGPVYLSKIDLSDGFYRLWLRPEDTLKLAVLIPGKPGEPPLLGIPLTNPMGWSESPPNFSACTETVADLANMELSRAHAVATARQAPHRLDKVSESAPSDTAGLTTHTALPLRPATAPSLKPERYWDIYVDDFCGLAQGNEWTRRAVKRILLHSLDQVFRPLDVTDTPYRQEPASIKKLKKGDATWATTKTILGWVVNTVTQTIQLPPNRVQRLHQILASIAPRQRFVAIKDWHKVLGELRSMAIAIPGARGLFSVLQEAFRHNDTNDNRPRLRLTNAVHDFLDDFRLLAKDVANRPTRIAELVPDVYPATLGACDAAGQGMGGVHFVPDKDGTIIPILWRQRFPPWISNRLVSFSNPDGDVTNSDLELAGSVAQNDVLAQFADVTERTVHNSYDNTATMYWQRKGSTTTTGPPAYLLRLQSLHQRHFRYVPLQDYIPGPANAMADDLSRRWNLTDAALLVYFNRTYPQSVPWTLCRLRPPVNSSIILALSRRRSAPALLQNAPKQRIRIGDCGMTTACRTVWTRSSEERATQCHTSPSTAPCTPTALSPPAVNPSHLAQWRTPCARSDRNSPAWGPKIPAWTAMEKLITG